jgi:hypothetical protein
MVPRCDKVTSDIVADNYHELWVNGEPVAVDATPYDDVVPLADCPIAT